MSRSRMELDQCISPSALRLLPKPLPDGGPAKFSTIEKRIPLSKVDIPDFRQKQAEDFHRLYGARSNERMESLETAYSDLGKPAHLIVTLFCSKYLPLFRNWLLSCDRKNIVVRDRTLAFCLDHESATACGNLGVKAYFVDPGLYPHAGHCQLFGDASFRKTMLYKNAVMLDALQSGARVLFQDTDLVWFKDPFPYLDKTDGEYDMQIMYDGPHHLYKPLHANTGFIYFQPTDATKAVLETALYNSASILFAGGHQAPFNHILNHFVSQKLLRLQVLPEQLFLNGHLFNLVNGVRAEAGNWEKNGIVLHYSWTGTMTEKLQKLRKFDLDLLDLTKDIQPFHSESNDEDVPFSVRISGNNVPNDSTDDSVPGRINLTLHISGQEPLLFTCDREASVVRDLFKTFLAKKKRERDNLIHLQVDDDDGTKDIYLRGALITGIETEPPLPHGFLERLGKKEAKPTLPAVRFLRRRVKRFLAREDEMRALFENNNYATDKFRAHSYIPVYEQIFRRRKRKTFNVLEIGIGGGGSLKLWHDYFKNAEVYGIDLNHTYPYLDRFSRIHQIKDDAYTQECVQKHFVSKNIRFDIIIDDGPHSKQSQMMAMQLYFPLLTKRGIIVIEDVQDHRDPGVWIEDIIGSLPVRYQKHAKVIDLRHLNKSPDDLLIVLDKSRIYPRFLFGH